MDKNHLIGISICSVVLLVLGLMTPITAKQIRPTTTPYQGSQYQILQPTKDNNDTVTITLKSGQFDMDTQTIRGILGYTFLIENRGIKEIWCDVIADQYAFFSHQLIANTKCSSNIPPEWGWFVNIIPVLYGHPLMTMTVRVTTNTSTNLTLERSAIELFSSFFVGWTGPESVTGPS